MNAMSEIDGLTLAEADRRLVAELSCEFSLAFGDRTTPEQEAARLDPLLDAGHRATALWRGGKALGAAIWIDMGDHVFIRRFWMVGDARRQGLGRAFFDRLVEGVFPLRRQIRLEVRDPPAKAFWSTLEFQEISIGMHLTREEA